jgi:hypothetical protein
LLRHVRFLAGAQLRLRWASVVLDDTDLSQPSILSWSPPFQWQDERERSLQPIWQSLPGPPRPQSQPWVRSLQRADVSGLTLSNADLEACRFRNTQNLDKLRVESPRAFPGVPRWKLVQTGWAWPPIWRWTNRRALAEEHLWRTEHERSLTRRAGWHDDSSWPATESCWVANPAPEIPLTHRWLRRLIRIIRAWPGNRQMLMRAFRVRRIRTLQRREQARDLANLYRALRKGREDAKDEPGAADF